MIDDPTLQVEYSSKELVEIIKGMRYENNYGFQRDYLNFKWEGWQEAVNHMRQLMCQ